MGGWQEELAECLEGCPGAGPSSSTSATELWLRAGLLTPLPLSVCPMNSVTPEADVLSGASVKRSQVLVTFWKRACGCRCSCLWFLVSRGILMELFPTPLGFSEPSASPNSLQNLMPSARSPSPLPPPLKVFDSLLQCAVGGGRAVCAVEMEALV